MQQESFKKSVSFNKLSYQLDKQIFIITNNVCFYIN